MSMPVVYIAGKMRGTSDLGRQHFRAMEMILREWGYRVMNPAILPTDLDEKSYMPICMAMLEQADMICMLDGWETSVGACAELAYANCRQKSVLHERDFL